MSQNMKNEGNHLLIVVVPGKQVISAWRWLRRHFSFLDTKDAAKTVRPIQGV
jgi:hypothetical protein